MRLDTAYVVKIVEKLDNNSEMEEGGFLFIPEVLLGGFPIKIENKISKLITYSLAILIPLKSAIFLVLWIGTDSILMA